MNIGTKSLIFGVHQVFIHPLWVALAWWKLYGFPWDPRLWVAFIVHDWGYWGCPEMDGKIGDHHPELGANILHLLFDSSFSFEAGKLIKRFHSDLTWYYFGMCHSRFLAKQLGHQPSKLCMADKLSLSLEPWWLYLPRAWITGELKEYMATAKPGGKHGHMNLPQASPIAWYKATQAYMVQYAMEHRDGKSDEVTQI